MKSLFFLLISFSFILANAQDVAILKYSGGGDWYANPTAVPNLVSFTNKTIGTTISNIQTVAINSEAIYNYPIVFMTGHGNVFFSETEVQNLKDYLISGGFLHISVCDLQPSKRYLLGRHLSLHTCLKLLMAKRSEKS